MFELDCDCQLNNSPLRTLWCLHELNVLAIALLIAPFIWFICLVHCSIFWQDKFWTSLGGEWNQFHVMSSSLLSNCLRILFCNVSHREQVNLSTWLIHQTVKAAGLCQHKVHCQCVNNVPDTIACLQTGHQHNLLQRHGFNLRCVKQTNWWNLAGRRHGWWEATIELWKARSSEW